MPEPKVVQKPEDDLSDHAFLGREFLTWLVWRADRGEAQFGAGASGDVRERAGKEAFALAFGGKARLVGLVGDVTDAVLKGRSPALGIETRAAIGAGRTVREAELRLTKGEREWRFTLLADTLDLRGVKLPALLTDEEDDRFLERISLLEELDDKIRSVYNEFLGERLRPAWVRSTIPAMRTWVAEGLTPEA